VISTVKKCILWATCLIVTSAALTAFGPDLVAALYPEIWNSPGGTAVFGGISLVVAILQNASMSVAGGLIGAAVVISTIRRQPRVPGQPDAPAPDGEHA
jgi:hypothetical protein